MAEPAEQTQPDGEAPVPTRAEVTATLTAPGGAFEMEEIIIRGAPVRTWKTAPATLRSVFELSALHGDKTFLVYEDERVTFEENFRIVAALGHQMVERFGIRPGDRVAPSPSVWKASTISASPASTASGSPKAACTEGLPRRVAASSKQGRSSCTSEAQCSSSMAAAAASVTPGESSPQAAATARQSRGRIRAPFGKTACRMAAARPGGQPGASARPTEASNARSIRPDTSIWLFPATVRLACQP